MASLLRPIALSVESLSQPLGIDVARPRLGWRLDEPSPTRGQRQTAYQVLAASDPDLLGTGDADLWDSGCVPSGESVHVSWAGEPLASGQACYWKVRVWDKDAVPGDWSETAWFTVGLLHASDWEGPWIRAVVGTVQRHPWYRRSFTLDDSARSAAIHVASIGYHELYVNGQKVDPRVLAPALTRLDRRVLYVTYDIAHLLRPGRNCLAIWCGPGWSRYDYFKTQHALRVQMHGRTHSGQRVAIASDHSWRCTVSCGENLGGCRYEDNGGELLDGRIDASSWNQPEFDDTAWAFATPVDLDVQLSAHLLEPSRVIQVFAGQSVEGSGPWRVDLGTNFTGWIALDMRSQQPGDRVVIRVSDNPDTAQAFTQQSVYICRGGDETFCNRFNYACGRYVTLEGLRAAPAPADVRGLAIGTDLQRTGQFDCDDPLLKRIYETDLWTFRANTVEGTTMDCPHRERLGYGEENFATAWGCGLPNYESEAFYLKLLRDWCDVQEPSGWIHHTAPQINEHYGGAMWSSAPLNLAWEIYLACGNRRALEMVYPVAKRWLDFLERHVEDGLLRPYTDQPGCFLGDWAAPLERKEFGDSPEALLFNNCVFAMNLATFLNLCGVLESNDDAAAYGRRLTELKAAIHRAFYNPITAAYLGGNQVQQAFALLTDIPPSDLKSAVRARLRAQMRERPYLDMGSSGLPVLLRYLIDSGEDDAWVYDTLRQTSEPSYGHFLARGETAWPEYWRGDVASRVHTCYTGIAAWFLAGLGGIRNAPRQPGCKAFTLRPAFPHGLNFASARRHSPYGAIESAWSRTADGIDWAIVVPPNTTAVAQLPADSRAVRESGVAIANAEGVAVRQADGRFHLDLQAGRYQLEIEIPSERA